MALLVNNNNKKLIKMLSWHDKLMSKEEASPAQTRKMREFHHLGGSTFSHNLEFKEKKSACVYFAASGTSANQMMNSPTARVAS